jgi:Uma2 family endonuclease
MSAIAIPKKQRSAATMRDVVIANGTEVRIPGSVVDLESFRRWARSDALPEHGWFSYLAGEIWVDLSMEQLFSHNGVKTEFTVVVGGLVRLERRGYFFSDRVLLSNPNADLSTEPDGSFVFFETIQTGRVRLIEGAAQGYVEIEGTPDMVLEIVSASSVHKDTERLRELYWQAGIAEYWLVDARGDAPQFDIFRHESKGYVATRRHNGWLRSRVFDRAFQLSATPDALGNPQYTLAIKS